MKPTDLMKHNENEEAIPRKEFDGFISAVGSEIEQTQVRTIVAANKQMLLHYWKMGNFILHNQRMQGWGAKVIDRISQAIREKYPHKKGYSPRNLKYMCKFARYYPLQTLQELILADEQIRNPTVKSMLELAGRLNDVETMQEKLEQFVQEPPAQMQNADNHENIIMQAIPAQIKQQAVAQILSVSKTMEIIMKQPIEHIENIFFYSPVADTNWASHMELMDSKLPLGIRYWYMKEQVEYGWSSNILDLLILCKGKNEVLARYALDGYLNPIGISDYQLSQAIPENLKSALPSIEEVENEIAARMKIKSK
jgi:ferritin